MTSTRSRILQTGLSSQSIRMALQLAALGTVSICTQALAADVTLTADDPNNTSSVAAAGRWSNNAAPSPDNDYFTAGFTLRTSTAAGEILFAGRSLTIDPGTNGRLLGKGAGSNTTQTLTVPSLILNGGRLEQAVGGTTTNAIFRIKGNINVTAPSFLGAAGTNANNSTIFEVLELDSVISGESDLLVAGTANGGQNRGVVRLNAANTFSGYIDVLSPSSGGTIPSATYRLLNLNHPDALRFAKLGLFTSQDNPASFSASANTANFRIGSLSGPSGQILADTEGNPVILEVGGTNLDSDYTGSLRGPGGLTKTGNGVMSLGSQMHTFTGPLTVQQGTVILGEGALLHNSSTVSISAGAKLHLDHPDTDIVRGLTLNGVAQPDGVYDVTTPGGYITGTGKLRVNTGAPLPDRIKLLANDPAGASSLVSAGHWSDAAAPDALNSYFTQAYTVRTPVAAGAITFAGASLSVDPNGRILGKGAGVVNSVQTLEVQNLILNGGRIEQASGSISGVVLRLNGNINVTGDSFVGAIASSTAFETLDIGAKISGSAPLRVGGTANASANSGNVKLSSENDYSGTISVEQPQAINAATNRLLQLNHLSALHRANLALITTTENGVSFSSAVNTGPFLLGALSGTASQTLADTAGNAVILDVGGNNTSSTFDGILGGPGSLTKSGTGKLTLNGLNSYAGATTVSGGTLSLASASLTDTATVTVAGGAVLELAHDQTDVVGSLVLDGVTKGAGIYNAANSGGRITGTGSLQVGGTVTAGFAGFMAAFPGLTEAQRAPDADPDGDGISNLMEYALAGMNPVTASTLPSLNGRNLSFAKRAEAVSSGVTYVIETSSTLGAAPSPWTAVTPEVDDAANISWTLPAGSGRNFARLRVTAAP